MSFPKSLLDEISDGLVIPFVGSGVSLSVKEGLFPTWIELLQAMAERLDAEGKPVDGQIVRLFCKKKQVFEAAKQSLENLGQAAFFDVLRERIPTKAPGDADLSLPKAIWNLGPSFVVTTNYDDVLGWAKTGARRILNSQTGELAAIHRANDRQRPAVWHLHGHIDTAGSLILAPKQYDAFYRDAEQQYEAALLQLRSLLVNYTLLFVGFGMQDEYVMQMVRGVLDTFSGSTRPHFALLKSGEADTASLWKEHNVQVIGYSDHGAPLVELLKQLSAEAQIHAAPQAKSGKQGKYQARRRAIVPLAYIEWLQKQCGQIEFLGMRRKQGQAVTLRHVYVPLAKPKFVDELQPVKEWGINQEKPPHELLMSLLADQSLYLSGAPGSGKSTFCRWLASAVGAGELPLHPIEPPQGFREEFPESLRGQLPLLVPLREFWHSLPKSAGAEELTWAEMEAVLQQWIARKRFDGLTWDDVKEHLDAGLALLIFDGVDEVPLTAGDHSHPTRPRAMLLAGLAQGIGHWSAPGNRVLVSSRPYGLSDNQQRQLGLQHAPVAELPDELQQLLVRRWFHCLREDSADAETTFQELWHDVGGRPEIAELAGNPLLLTAMCVVYGEDGRLPQDEFDLYDRIVDTVLFHRYPEKSLLAAAARSHLCVIAHGMHTGEALGESREQPRAEATVDEIDRMLQHYQDHRPGTELHKLTAVDAREDLLSNSGLLLPRGDDRRAGFYHFTFQDFLAAERLYDLHADPGDLFRRRGPSPEWRKALVLLFGAVLHKKSTPDQAVSLVSRLIADLGIDEFGLGAVLAECLTVLRGRGKAVDRDTEQRFIGFCLDAIKREAPLKERHALALALGRLSDPRVALDLRNPDDLRAWVQIPAGDYWYGDEKKHIRIEQAYFLSRFPVTNSQFRVFVDNGGYQDQQWWSEEGRKWKEKENVNEPAYWNDPIWNGLTRPVVGVNWYEADAYARWAGGRLPTYVGFRVSRTQN